MCFNKKGFIEDSLLTAIEDIVVYKVMKAKYSDDHSARSPVYNFDYTVNKLYQNLDCFKLCRGSAIDAGGSWFHIHEAFHSYATYKDAKYMNVCGNKIYPCLIPKGSLYIVDDYNIEVVSNQIIVSVAIKLRSK